ncbi:MAG: hypothetical protein AB9873_14360 [Syntrophobacteraceae bacterium]
MEHTEQKVRKKNAIAALLNWLGVVEKTEDGTCPLPSDPENHGDGSESPCIPASEEGLSPNVQVVSGKVLTLKKSLEFEDGLIGRLDPISSARDLLMFIQDGLLYRFDQLQKIGLMSQSSYRFIASLNEKIAALAASSPDGSAMDTEALEELKRENEDLKQRIESIHAKYVKSGVITDEDQDKDREIARLNARVRDQRSQMKIAKKRLDALASYQEMIQTLRVRNGFLTSKTEQQAKLLRSLTKNNPEHEKLLSAVSTLTEENKQLKRDLERQSHLLNQLRDHIPPDAQVVVDELLKRNTALWDDLQDKVGQLDAALPEGRDIHDHLDDLQERNHQLKQTLETTQTLDRYLQEYGEGRGDFNTVVDVLKSENDRLQRCLTAKEEQIKTMTADPASKQLMQAYSRLQHEYRQIFKESQVKDQLYRQEVSQREGLISQVRERTALIKENQRLKVELDSTKRLAQSFKRSEQQFVQLKKVNSELELKHQRATAELEEARKKLSRVTMEHKLLMAEYENIFGRP